MPSSKILEQKKQVVAELAELIKNSPAGVLVNYQGITVIDDTKMRRELREAGVKYMVMKNSLTGRACDAVGYGDLKEHLVGMTAIAIAGDDPVAPAKIIKNYADKIKVTTAYSAAYLEGRAIDADTVIALAGTPSRGALPSSSAASRPRSTRSPTCSRPLSTKQASEETAPAGTTSIQSYIKPQNYLSGKPLFIRR